MNTGGVRLQRHAKSLVLILEMISKDPRTAETEFNFADAQMVNWAHSLASFAIEQQLPKLVERLSREGGADFNGD
jgi:hypothetical protein